MIVEGLQYVKPNVREYVVSEIKLPVYKRKDYIVSLELASLYFSMEVECGGGVREKYGLGQFARFRVRMVCHVMDRKTVCWDAIIYSA